MTGLLELFLFGTVGFWILIALELLLLFVFTLKEDGVLATLSLIVFGLILQFVSGVNIIGFVLQHPIQIISVVVLYFVIGFIWGIFKWWDFLRAFKNKYDDIRTKWLSSHSDTSAEAWQKYLIGEYSRDYSANSHIFDKAPQIHDNKGRWMRWAAFWPMSIICYVIGDLIVNIFNGFYRHIAGYLQGMSDRMFSSITNDLK